MRWQLQIGDVLHTLFNASAHSGWMVSVLLPARLLRLMSVCACVCAFTPWIPAVLLLLLTHRWRLRPLT